MKGKVVFAIVIVIFSCNTNKKKVNEYGLLLEKLDIIFFRTDTASENRLEKLKAAMLIAKNQGYNSRDFQNAVGAIEYYYKDIISEPSVSQIWYIGSSTMGSMDNPVIVMDLRVKKTKSYLDLLDKVEKNYGYIEDYRNFYTEMGEIPVNIDFLNLIVDMDLKDDDNRLFFYIHIITWFSQYPTPRGL